MWSPTGLIPWFSKIEGNTYATLLHHPFLFKGKPTQCSRGSMIHDRSLNKKHDCNDFIINSIDVNCANNMQNPKLGDANFAMSSTCCNDHDWGDSSYDLENLFKPHDEYVCDNIESEFGRASTLSKNNPTYLESVQSYEFFDKSGFGEVMTLVNVNPTILEECQLCMHVVHKIFSTRSTCMQS